MNRPCSIFRINYNQRHREFDLDFTAPLIIVFLVLLFIIFRSDFAPTPGVAIRLPQAENVTFHAGAEAMLVVVDRQGRYFFRHQIVDEETLLSRLHQFRKIISADRPLIVRADQSLDLNAFIRIHNVCRRAGISNLVLEVNPSKIENQNAYFEVR